jgi:two-component system chemotaxis sensor kinase CheA
MSPFQDDRGAEMRELFFETSQELLQSLNDDALKLEKSPQDREIVRSIRRTVHTLKGDSAACGFTELSELAHALEDALAVESPSGEISLVELSLKAADIFGAMLAAYRQQAPLPDVRQLTSMAQALAGGSNARRERKSASKAPPLAWTEYEKNAAEVARHSGKRVFHIVAHIDQLCAMPIAARQLVSSSLAAISEVIAVRPEAQAAARVKHLDLLIATSAGETDIVSKCLIPTVISRVEYFELRSSGESGGSAPPSTGEASLAAERPTRVEPSASKAAPAPLTPENVLRVEAERIDNVLNLVGELIVAKSMLQQGMNEFSRRFAKDGLRARFADAMAFQSRVLNDLQRSVMKIRMVPVEQLFRRFPRVVRDSAKVCQKQVQLEIRGQDTDVDKGLLDAIAEPLTHIVRNAVSHGIETPREREKAGKPPTGTIQLNAYHQANQLIVEVTDDGSGIDISKLKTKAVNAGILRPEEAANMLPQETMDVIFRPGFSTAEEITEISGRGVGLDVVRNVLLRLKGSVEVETEVGNGTTFRLKLPLTLAIIQALMFRIEHRLYAVPLNAVAEIARAWEDDIHRVGSTEVLQLRNEVLPLVRLAPCPMPGLQSRKAKIFVLVLSFGERKLGLIVDSMEGEEELVIKALDDQTIATDMVSSASILGDGRVVLIMNLVALMDRFTRSGTNAAQSGLLARTQQSGSGPEVRP